MKKIKLRGMTWIFALAVALAGAFMMMPKAVEAAEGDVEINETNFPDEVFRKYVEDSFDENKDKVLSNAEIAAVTEIDVTNAMTTFPEATDIRTLEGIEKFKNLKKLSCAFNKISDLDLKENQELTYLNLNFNEVIKLDVSKNLNLIYLSCDGNKLESLDVTNNTNLETLICSQNDLKNLDISKNKKLKTLDCASNFNLAMIDVNANSELIYLQCSALAITQLDVDNNLKLEVLVCNSDNLLSLDVKKNTELRELSCYDNQLKSLDLSNNTKLASVNCSWNQLEELDLKNNQELTTLYCHYNKLVSLNIPNNKKLEDLACTQNLLPYLDVSNSCDKLEELYCENNLLEYLNVGTANLMFLKCSNNRLTSLDITGSEYFGMLECLEQQKTVKVSSRRQFDLSTLPGNFDVSKTSNWQGGTVQGNVLTFIDDTVTYTYDVGKGESVTFTLVAVAGGPEIKDPDSSTTQPSNPSTQTPVSQTPSVSAPSTPAVTEKISAGTTVTDAKSKSVYKVAGSAASGYTVTYVRPASKKAKTVVIPATVTVNGVSCKVTSIANNAFKGQKKLKKVTIGANVTTIGKKAFFGCKELKKVTIKSKQLKKVGAKAFAKINAKAKIKVPKNKKKAYKKLFKKNTGVRGSML